MLIHKMLSEDLIEPDFRKSNDIQKDLLALLHKRISVSIPLDNLPLHEYRGDDFTIFHNLIPGIRETLIFLAVAPEGIDDQEHASKLLILILSPMKESGRHLQLLSRLTALFSNRRFLEGLTAKKNSEEIIRAVKLEEEGGHENYWIFSKDEIFEDLKTGDQGLSESEAQKRLAEVGPNKIERARRRPLILRLSANLLNLFALLLWAASIFSYMAGMVELAKAIPLVILINAFFSFWQEYRAEKAIYALEKLLPSDCRLIRNGKVFTTEAAKVVPGDLVILEAGDQVPADIRLVEANDFRVDNSALTGESRPSYRFDKPLEERGEFLWVEIPNLIFAGTSVLSGTARGVVIATGMDTELGQIASLTQSMSEKPSPLQVQIHGVAKVVAVVALSVGIFFFLAGLLTGKLTFTHSLVFGIGVIVAFVPEGLLPTLSLALALAVQRMAKKNALIKRLSAVEALGSTTVICTDKTGTLTTNENMVERIWLGGTAFSVGKAGEKEILTPEGKEPVADKLESPLISLMADCAVLCNNATWNEDLARPIGDPTEAALLRLADMSEKSVNEIRKNQPRINLFPFESVRKRMSTVNENPGGKVRAWVKGAPESIIDLCNNMTSWDGSLRTITEHDRAMIIQVSNQMAQSGLRILALAWKDMESSEADQGKVEGDLNFIGIVGMLDPPREEVPLAIERCHRAGIRVFMITGDFSITALAVAQKIGMRLSKKLPVITGDRLSSLSDVQLQRLLKRRQEMIFARTSPQDKLRIVTALQKLGETVAVTGDGVNDGPALKASDIGVAMGRRGTDVSREAAGMILADDNFASIVAAIEEGRAVYANIKRFITYIFASNIAEAIPFIAFVLFGIPLPLGIMQILAVDLGADLLPALALGSEPAEPDVMQRPPRLRKEHLIDLALARRFIFLGILTAAAGLGSYFFAFFTMGYYPGAIFPETGPLYAHATTMCYGGIISAASGNAMALRTDRESILRIGLFSNRLLLGGIFTAVLFLAALSYLPLLQDVFQTAPLSAKDWLFLSLLPPVPVIADEIRKIWLRRLIIKKN